MQDIIEQVAASPVWHVIYPLLEIQFCYVTDERTWQLVGASGQWSPKHIPLVARIEPVMELLGLNVYTTALAPYHYENSTAILLPERNEVMALAKSLGKTLYLHRCEGDTYHGFTLRHIFCVEGSALTRGIP